MQPGIKTKCVHYLILKSSSSSSDGLDPLFCVFTPSFQVQLAYFLACWDSSSHSGVFWPWGPQLPGIWFLYFLPHVLPAPPCIGSTPQGEEGPRDLSSRPTHLELNRESSSLRGHSSFGETGDREIGQGARGLSSG